MAIKRKSPLPPSQPHYSDDDSLDDEEQQNGEETETDHSDSDPDLPTKSPVALPDLSGSEDLSGFDESLFEEKGEEQLEKLKMGVKAPEIEPYMKRLKLSEPEQSPFKKSTYAFERIWSKEDEMVLLNALSKYKSVKGKLPQPKDQASFLTSFRGFLDFLPTLEQLTNKINMLRRGFLDNIKKGPNVKIKNPHKRTVFEMCTKLFQGVTKRSQKGIQLEFNNGDLENAVLASDGKANGAMLNCSPANSGSGNGAQAETGPCIHLRSMIEDMISRQQCEKWISVEGVIARIGEARAQSLEAKTKKLSLDAIKLRARKKKLKAEVFGFLAKEMTNE